MIVINDTHIAANRVAGTTPASAAALKQWTIDSLTVFLETVNEDILVAGDLLDSFHIPNTELLATYRMMDKWLEKGYGLYILKGNHDKSKDSSKLSSFDLLGELLGNRASFISEPAMVGEDIYLVPDSTNQDEFDMWVASIPECTYCVMHCNYENPFAVNSDHSLNLSKAQAEKIPAKVIYLGHEHTARVELDGKVFIGGVQFPASISDCLSKKDMFAYRLTGTTLEPIKTWSKGNYAELDWRNPTPSDAQFIRFVGSAKPEEAAEVADKLAKYRKTSQAFIVSNAVRVGEDVEGAECSVQSLEQARSFDVMAALREILSKEQVTILESLT